MLYESLLGFSFSLVLPLGQTGLKLEDQNCQMSQFSVRANSIGKTLCIFKAGDDKAEAAADGKAGTAKTAPKVATSEAGETAAVAFFQCASEIQTFDVSEFERSHIAVGCADGQVLQLRAAVLLT